MSSSNFHHSHHGRHHDTDSKFSKRSHKNGTPSYVSHGAHSRSRSSHRHENHAVKDHISQHGKLKLHHSSHNRHGLHKGAREMASCGFSSCSAGLYSKILGPTADETVLAGLQTLVGIFCHCSRFDNRHVDVHTAISHQMKRLEHGKHHSKHHIKKHYGSSHHTGHKYHHDEHKSHHTGH